MPKRRNDRKRSKHDERRRKQSQSKSVSMNKSSLSSYAPLLQLPKKPQIPNKSSYQRLINPFQQKSKKSSLAYSNNPFLQSTGPHHRPAYNPFQQNSSNPFYQQLDKLNSNGQVQRRVRFADSTHLTPPVHHPHDADDDLFMAPDTPTDTDSPFDTDSDETYQDESDTDRSVRNVKLHRGSQLGDMQRIGPAILEAYSIIKECAIELGIIRESEDDMEWQPEPEIPVLLIRTEEEAVCYDEGRVMQPRGSERPVEVNQYEEYCTARPKAVDECDLPY